MEPIHTKGEANKETTRMEAFSDGVFAIAITLLILEIHVPEVVPGTSLLHQLLYHQWASFLAFTIGFFTILICWINHHYMFTMIYRSNSNLLLINGFKLLIVTTTPFATALLSKHIQTEWGPSAIKLYAFNFALMGLAMTGIWCYAHYMGFANAVSDKVLKVTRRYYIFAAILSSLIWIVSYFSIIGSLVLFAVMFLVFVFPEKMVSFMVARVKG
jgi:uncharacterized membrane protein